MKFGEALEYLYGNKKDDKGVQRKQRIAREGWNGKGMYLVMFSDVCMVINDEKLHSADEMYVANNYCFENIHILNNEEQLCKLEDFISSYNSLPSRLLSPAPTKIALELELA